jgi:hypothetical protein
MSNIIPRTTLNFSGLIASCNDLLVVIFASNPFEKRFKTLEALASTNTAFFQEIMSSKEGKKSFKERLIFKLDLKQSCPGLNILDAGGFGEKLESIIDKHKFEVIEAYENLASHGLRGSTELTLLTMHKGRTIKQLMDQAAKQMIVVQTAERQLIPFYHVPMKSSQLVLITHGIFVKSLGNSYKDQCQLAINTEWAIPTVSELLTLIACTKMMANRCLLSDGIWGSAAPLHEEGLSWAFACTHGNPLPILRISYDLSSIMKNTGFGGVKRFSID